MQLEVIYYQVKRIKDNFNFSWLQKKENGQKYLKIKEETSKAFENSEYKSILYDPIMFTPKHVFLGSSKVAIKQDDWNKK